jgi:sugar lactone lactonase YvrE
MTRTRGLALLIGLLSAGAVVHSCSSSSNNPAGQGGSGSGGSKPTSASSTSASSTSGSSTGGSSTSGSSTGGGPSDGGPGDASDGGPITVEFDPTGTGSPDAIYWDDAKQTLYIVDDTKNQVWTYTDKDGLQKLATVPDNAALDDAGREKLNGVTELANGTLVITRFGFGTGGAIYTLSADGGTATVPNVPANRKRIAVTVDPATGTVYSDSFVGGGGTMPSGQIETVSLATGTTTFASGFGKTVGLLVQNGAILVSDQTNGVILSVPLDPTLLADGGAGLVDGAAFPVFATLEGPDQLSAGPNGTVYTGEFLPPTDGGGTPQVRQIFPDGGVVVPWPTFTFTSLADVAYDPTNHRLFVVDSNGTTVRTIRIFPVSP